MFSPEWVSPGTTQVQEYTNILLYSAQVLTSKTVALCDYLLDAVANPAFKSWEIPDATRRVGLDVSAIDPAVRATELLHKAAYREGLGNSLYSPQHMVGFKNNRIYLLSNMQ